MLKLNAPRFGLASAVAALIVWVICSLLVFGLGAMMMDMTAYMVHGEMSGMNWSMSLQSVMLGGLAWVLSFGVTGWLIAALYNSFGSSKA
ncbi:MAG: DUF5676 family membrane protein [Burkholderiaceae bacterium]